VIPHPAGPGPATPVFAGLRREPWAARIWWLALAIGLALRLGVYLYAFQFPIINEDGTPVSPALEQRSTDFGGYAQMAETLRHIGLAEIVDRLINSIDERGAVAARPVITPVLPALILATDYSTDNTVPLSLLFLAASCATFAIWLHIFRRLGLAPPWALLYALLPTPLWFTVNMTLDTLMALFLAVFCLVYFVGPTGRLRLLALVLLVPLCAFTRPNGAFLIGFLIADAALYGRFAQAWRKVALAVSILVALGVAAVLLPVFLREVEITFDGFTYFGFTTPELLAGIYDGLPAALDRTLSWATLALFKGLYFCGFRPSFGETAGLMLAVRATPGLLLFPGLLYLLWAAEPRLKLFFLCFAFPIFLHLPQERYSLPVQPLLFLYAALLCERLYARFAARPATPRSDNATNSPTA